MDARIALLFQESAHFVLGEIGGYGDGERNGQARIRFLGVAFELPADRFSVVALYRFAAAATVQRAEARVQQLQVIVEFGHGAHGAARIRSEEHTSELQSLMRISYAVFCLKKKKPYN